MCVSVHGPTPVDALLYLKRKVFVNVASRKCEHGVTKYYCIKCGGSQTCLHGYADKRHCKQCGEGRHRRYIRRHSSKMYTVYKHNACARSLAFLLTPQEFVSLVAQCCTYCGRTPKDAGGMGVDRVVNTVGYKVGNCVSCCAPCNKMKHILEIQEFLQHIECISTYQK